MVSNIESALEMLLRQLGAQQRDLEQAIRQNMRDMKDAYRAGNPQLGDQLEHAIDRARAILTEIGPKVAGLETRLYALRRKKK